MTLPLMAVVDTGVDDALALIVAVRHPALDLRAVVCTAGNVPLRRVWANTHYVLDLLEARVPVALGAERRLDGGGYGDRSVHGPDGLAGLGPRADARRPLDAPAPAELVTPGTLVVSLGPLTPVAGLAAGRIVASYARPGQANYEMDSQAAAQVRVEHTDVPDHPVELVNARGRVAELARGLLAHQQRRGAGLGDAAVMLALAEPDLDPRHWARRVQALAAAGD